jgi:phosphoglycolate phosphatase-like HAD superfamily hydrolase
LDRDTFDMTAMGLNGGPRARSFWWDRGRCAHTEVPALEAVIFDIDGVLTDPDSDAGTVCELMWSLHCSGVRIALVTVESRSDAEPLIRRLVGDGVVEVLITGDEVDRPKPDPEFYVIALDELGVRAANAMAVEDCALGLRAARAAGLATVIVGADETQGHDFTGAAAVLPGYGGPEPLSAHRCRRLRERWWIGHQRLSA